MAGLLGEIFSRADRMKRGLLDFAANPFDSIQQTAGLLVDAHSRNQRLLDAAFADKSNPLQITDAGALGEVAESMLMGPLSFAPAGTILYHGTNSPSPLRRVDPRGGIFEGIFASPGKGSALSHGEYLYRSTIPDRAVLRQRALDYELDPSAVDAALRKAAPWMSQDDMDLAYRAIVEDASHKIDPEDLMRALRAEGPDEASWEAQRLRGQVAKNLGFRAVEMNDEHGLSYLIPTPETLRPANQKAKELWKKAR